MYKVVAFKEATNLLAAAVAGTVPSEEPAQEGICNRLNGRYGLVSGSGRKQVARSTIYQATTKDGLAGQSPKKRGGPVPKIPDAFLNGLASQHVQVCQVGDGELRATQMKRVIGWCFYHVGNPIRE